MAKQTKVYKDVPRAGRPEVPAWRHAPRAAQRARPGRDLGLSSAVSCETVTMRKEPAAIERRTVTLAVGSERLQRISG